MAKVLDRIDRLEKSRLTAPKTDIVDELYALPLIAAFVLLALALATGETLWQKVPA